jgi:medium-chain acyl-[acyl-carrier-protein] hydrolase
METPILHIPFQVKSWDADSNRRMTFAALSRYFQEAAHRHAEKLGFGYERMLGNGMAWVLGRIQIRLIEAPIWEQEVLVETWPKGKDQAYYLRDFRIEDAKGQHMGSATSSWLLIDINNRRPRSFKPLDALAMDIPDRHAIRSLAPRLAPLQGIPEHFQHKVMHSDIDVNGHMNFSQYVRLMEDLFFENGKEYRQIRELNINFLSELHKGDIIDIQRIMNTGDKCCYFSFLNRELNTESARAQILFA